MAATKNILQVADIVKSDKDRHIVVVSAPGKRFKEDEKVTDLLYASFAEAQSTGDCSKSFSKIRDRLEGLVSELKLLL
jgi:aspartate kinase